MNDKLSINIKDKKAEDTSKLEDHEKFITRFAPSPTGFLHIGNARTAIFNYLLSKHYNGSFLLRIEDTDQARFTQEAVDVIFDSLKFLGIKHDNQELIYQSKRTARYHEVVQELLAKGLAYKCYHTIEELEAIKNQAQEQNDSKAFRSIYRTESGTESSNTDSTKTNSTKPFVVRLKIQDINTDETQTDHTKDQALAETTFEDLVQGRITVKNQDIEDFTLLRSDGSPTYMLAVCVDDHDMNITHVFRGADHLTNTFKQLQIFKAMKWKEPHYAHIPLIHDISGKKLSKRDGAIGVLDYAKQGILPQALFNYLMRLGWGHKDEEFIPLDKAIEIFSEKGLGKSAAKFDFAKLLDLNSKWIRFLPLDQLLEYAKQYAQEYWNSKHESNQNDNNQGQSSKDQNSTNNNKPTQTLYPDEKGWERFAKGLEGLRIRAKTLLELLENGKIYFSQYVDSTDLPPLPEKELSLIQQFVEQFLDTFLKPCVADSLHNDLRLEGKNNQDNNNQDNNNQDNNAPANNEKKLEAAFRDFCSINNLEFKTIAPWLRKKLTGQAVSPSLFNVMIVLGKDICLERLRQE